MTYADYTSKKRSAVFKRVKKKYSSKSENPGVTLEDYIQIFSVLIHIDDVDKVSSISNSSLYFLPFQNVVKLNILIWNLHIGPRNL